MNNIEQKALELVNEVAQDVRYEPDDFEEERRDTFKALCRAIEQHEAFRKEVSDAVEEIAKAWGTADPAWGYLRRFIIAKPDPLVDAMAELNYIDPKNTAKNLRAALAKRGGRIVFDDV